jgi:hypothetical protein
LKSDVIVVLRIVEDAEEDVSLAWWKGKELGFNVGEEKERLPQSRSIIFWVGRRENATEQNYFGVGRAKRKGRRTQCREEKGREKNADQK